MKRLYTLFSILTFIIIILSSNISSFAQSEGMRLAFGFTGGGSKYWGEFKDNQFWLAGEGFFRYNIFSSLSLQASFGITQIRYKTNLDAFNDYPDYFGKTKINVGTSLYPGTDRIIQDKNSTWITTYELVASYNFFPSQSFVPFIFGGAGYMQFEPKIGDTGYEGAAPNNIKGLYKKTGVEFPVGIGFETYLTDDLVLNGKVTYRFVGTDYLDDLADADYKNQIPQPVRGGSPGNDKLLTFGVGLSYYILGDADYDNDGITNARERELSTDPRNPDTDGDGLNDGDEYYKYHTNPLKPDTDGDGLTDYEEVMKYHTNPNNPDTDGDGLNDGAEVNTYKTNPTNPDTDGDGLRDGEEVNKYGTDPLNPDTDGDGLTDGDEVHKYNTDPKNQDTDADGLNDGDEVKVYKTNPIVADTDGDGLKDGAEVKQYKTDPLNPDTDADGLQDGAEVNDYGTNPLKADSDEDGLNDGDEVRKFKTNPIVADTDKDGLTDGDEVLKYMTDPLKQDTDGDGLSDGDEVLKYKTDPLKVDTDGDGLSDGDEVLKYKTNPLLVDTDNDKLSDYDEVMKTKTDPNNPDTDGDKIIDGEDDCPLVAGAASTVKGKNGCPQPPKVGTKTDFPDILFAVNTDKFNFDESATALNLAKLLEYVKQCDGLQVTLEGHASEEGNKKRNQELSDLRAKKVAQWLIEQGVKPSAISGSIGYGSSQPKVKEPTGKALKDMKKDELEKIRKQNRRITVKVTKTCS